MRVISDHHPCEREIQFGLRVNGSQSHSRGTEQCCYLEEGEKREDAQRKVARLSWGVDKAKLYEGDVQNLQ